MDKVDKALDKLTPKEKERIKKIVKALRLGRFDNLDIKKLRGTDNVFRVRKGDLRIIYQVRYGQVFVLKLGHRRENTYKILNRLTGVTFILIKPFGQILMQLRDANSKRYPNMWCFPGGTMDYNEEPLATVIREVKEEYGLEIEKAGCTELMTYDLPYGVSAKAYVCKINQDQTPILNEGADMRWMVIDEIASLQLGFGQTVILPKLKEFLQQREER